MKKKNVRFIVILLVGLLGLAGCGSQEGGTEPLQSIPILPETEGERPDSGVEESMKIKDFHAQVCAASGTNIGPLATPDGRGMRASSGVGENRQDDRIQEDAGTENIQTDTERTGNVQKGDESSTADTAQVPQEATYTETPSEDGYSEESKSSSGHYFVVTSLSDEEVENFAAKVKEQILESDFAGLAEEIAYPITIDEVTYEDAAAFLGDSMTWEINPNFLTELEAESCREMFANYQGIMMGNGIVWIGSAEGELKVIGINGMAVQ